MVLVVFVVWLVLVLDYMVFSFCVLSCEFEGGAGVTYVRFGGVGWCRWVAGVV